jgi:hypothetical protein
LGWLITQGQTRKQLIANRTRTWTSEDGRVESVCLAHCWRGNITHSGRIWSVREHRHNDEAGTVVRAERYIALDLCRYDAGYGWGYKDLEETCGPNEVDCPEKYLEMVPDPPEGEHVQGWRLEVQKWHATRRQAASIIKTAKPGDVLELKPGSVPPRLKVCEVGKRHLFGRTDVLGGEYKILARHVAINLGPEAAVVPSP